jgi:enamine deaminase RidA (YjgF/YER057c/UK114 family)
LREEDAPIDPEARHTHGLWKGTPIKLETDFIIKRKLKPTLAAVNAGLETVVKAQVYLRDQEDIPGFREIWAQHFPVEPATTIIATETPGFIMPESRIEINTIALAKDGKTAKQVIAPIPPLFQGSSTAIRAGEFLFISGLMAMRDGSLLPEAKVDPTQPFYANPVKAELREILTQAEAICRHAGTSLKNGSHSTIPYRFGGPSYDARRLVRGNRRNGAPAVPCGSTLASRAGRAAANRFVGVHPRARYSAVIRPFSLARILRITKICNDRRERGRQEWL